MKTCYIFAAAFRLPKSFKKREEDLVIAADGGLAHLEKMKTIPDILLGDFDSLQSEPMAKEIIRLPVKKDDTDTLFAVKVGLERGFTRFVVYGGVGKRLDHTLANLQVLNFIAAKGGRGFLCGDDFTATAVMNSEISFSENAKGTLSVFSASGKADGVGLEGVLYPLTNARISCEFPIGVSNEFIGKTAKVSVTDGTLTVIWSGDEKVVI